jgi:thiamine transport system substrate-binding protein
MRPARLAALALAACPFAAPPLVAEERILTVYTYDSFVSEWGPGPQVREAFEAVCDCTLNLVGAGDGAALLARLRLEGDRSPADIVLGLDTNLIPEARPLFAEHGIEPPALDLPVEWDDAHFLPYDWGWFAFVHDRERVPEPPASFAELVESDLSIVIQDPRSSTPGLGLLLWVQTVFGDEADAIWEGLDDRIVTVTAGWSEAYGMFLEGEADMVLSYQSSPAYHIVAEEDDSKAAALFEEGHYMQIEVAGITATAAEPELARDFLDFMLTEGFQSVIPTTNWMYPAVLPEEGMPEAFAALPRPETSLLLPPEEARAAREPALQTWLSALTR